MVRGAGNASLAVVSAVQKVFGDEQLTFLSWAERVRFGGRSVLPRPFPKTVADMAQIPAYSESDTHETLKLLNIRFLAHRKKITDFLSRKEEYNRYLLNSEYQKCSEVLKYVEENFGSSAWLLEGKIALLSEYEGLQAQKEFSASVGTRAPKTLIAALAHYFSQRNEPSVSPVRFISRIENAVQRSELSPPLKVYLRFRLTRIPPSDLGDLGHILTYDHALSLIDAYDSFVEIAAELACTQPTIFKEALLGYVMALRPIGDRRLAKLLFLYGKEGAPTLKPRSLKIDNLLIEGPHRISALEEYAGDDEDPRRIWIEAFYAAVCEEPSKKPTTLREKIVSLMSDLFEDPVVAEDSAMSILKIGLNFRLGHTFFPMLYFAQDLFSDDFPFSSMRQLQAGITSGYLDPWELPFVAPDLRDRYKQALLETYKNEPAVQYAISLVCANTPEVYHKAKQFELLREIVRGIKAKQLEVVAEYASDLSTYEGFRWLGLRWQCNSLLEEGQLREAVKIMSSVSVKSIHSLAVLPIRRFFENKRWSDLEPLSNEIGLAIICDLYWRRGGGSEINSFRRYATEDFLTSRNVQMPSELRDQLSQLDHELAIYFLSVVCVPSVLDLMTAFDTSRSVQEERRRICALLTEIDPSNADTYRDELTHITQTLVLEEGVHRLDQSRIFVDNEALVQWADRELRESFERFRSLQKVSMGITGQSFAEAVRAFMLHRQPLPSEFLEPPKDEADQLLLRLISDLKDNFLRSPTHGLDSFLSVRVRHGTLSGMLRGPLESAKIIHQRRSGTNRYEDDEYWRTRFPEAPSDLQQIILQSIRSFSEGYDALIEKLRMKLQIRGSEHPLGLFDIPLTTVHIYILKEVIQFDTRFEDFLRECIEVFWHLIGESLNAAKQYVEVTVRQEIGALVAKLESNLQAATRGYGNTALMDAVHQSSTAVQGVLDNIKNWFQVPSMSSNPAYPIGLAVDIAIEAVRTTYRNFEPQIHKTISTAENVLGNSIILSDIIFTALDNVHKHSGVPRDPEVWISIEEYESGGLKLDVENELSATIDIAEIRKKIEEAQQKVSRREYKTRAVSAEGGTGLLKLKNFVDPSGTRGDALEFGIRPNGRFGVSVLIETYRRGS